MKVAVLGFGGRADVVDEAEQMRPVIERYAEIAVVDFEGQAELADFELDYVIVFGGDGSILRAARQMSYRQVPVIAVNLGKLGFLADLSPGELEAVLQRAQQGPVPLITHLMLECEARRDGEVTVRELVLNEVAVLNGPPYAIMDIDVYVDAELATTYSGDGLIVATPVGSTAHSLSAGGPIVRKDIDALVICPISPHTLSNRPVVDSANRHYELSVRQPREHTSLVIDGHVGTTLTESDRVHIRRANAQFMLVSGPGHSYYRTLREKLGWGGRLRYRADGKARP